MASLICPVRGCGTPLDKQPAGLLCARGHAFDRSRSGYVNLLQPQDSRSRHPGDSREAVQARRRFADAGHEDWLLAELLAEYDALEPARSGRRAVAVLDVGCGEGFLLASLARARGVEAHGIDISTPAIEFAAKRDPGPSWIVGNADRFLPWKDRSFDFVTSITARRNGPEMQRVLAPKGRVLVVVPAADDLIELREALLGEGIRKDRATSAVGELAPHLELVSQREVRRRISLDAPAVGDLLAATYRGGRSRERERADSLGALDVTMSRELLLFRSGLPSER